MSNCVFVCVCVCVCVGVSEWMCEWNVCISSQHTHSPQPHNTLLIGSCKHYTHTLLKHRLPPPNSLHKHTTHTQAHTTITQKAQFQNVQVIFNGLCWDLVGVEAGGGGLGWGVYTTIQNRTEKHSPKYPRKWGTCNIGEGVGRIQHHTKLNNNKKAFMKISKKIRYMYYQYHGKN